MLIRKTLVCLCFVMLSVQGYARAGEPGFEIEKGVFIGASWVHNSIGGDFNDTRYYYDDQGINYSVPNVDDGMGFGLTLGYRLERFAVELTYQRVGHDTYSTFAGIGDEDSYYNVVDLNVKVDVLARGRVRPFVLAGIGAPWYDLENARTTDGIEFSDETFVGFSLNAGGGLAVYITPRWFINATAMYRWQEFKQVDNLELSVDTRADGVNLSVGLAYTF